MKLRTRLLSMLLTLSLIPILIYSIVSISLFASISKKNTYQLNQEKLEIAKSKIDGMIDKNFNTLHMVANQPAIRNFDLINAKSILKEAAKVNPDLVISLVNSFGQEVVKSNNESFSNVAEREFFIKAMNGVEEYVSDILISKVTDKTNVVMSTPIRDSHDIIIGVLQASTELTKISDFVTKLSEGDSNVYVLSRNGIVLAHSNMEYVQNQEDFSSLEFVQSGLEGQNATLQTTNYLGEKVIVSNALDKMSGWLIVVETPVSVAMASTYNLLNISVILFIVAAIIVVVLGLFFSKRFTKPLVDICSIIQTIASGELKEIEIKNKSKDEIGQLFSGLKTMTQNLRGLVGSIQGVASTLASHALELSTATEESNQSLTQVVTTLNEMAQDNGDQAIMIKDTTDAISRVNDIISEAAKRTEVASDKAKESLALAKEGQRALEYQSQKIEENNRYTYAVGESIQQLATMANEIRNIVGAIDNISEQTNLLALNASIEAARAGEAGQGFAVVAEEIRRLAEQSSNSTKKIEDIINGINGGVNETVYNMNQVKESVHVMETSAENTKEGFAKIFTSITELAQISHEISTALEEINNQTRTVTSQAMNISAVVEQTSAGMEEISASSQEQLATIETISHSSGELDNVAKNLLMEVKKFKI